ncbi:hypothetical protein [Amycolatopsis magusensis]|uniref:hypothetical protein n=1 Tax=Amycolatopsis magusensis TaxID=882444 RepID=UPI00378D10B7
MSPAQSRTSPPGHWPIGADEVFLRPDRQPPGTDDAALSRYGASRWVFNVLGVNAHSGGKSVNWTRFPEPLRESFRRAGWVFCNLPTPEELLDRADARRVRWPSPLSIASLLSGCRLFASWLHERGIDQLGHLTEDTLIDYARHVKNRSVAEATGTAALYAVSRLWGAAPHLPPADRIPMPPWEATAMQDFLPRAQRSNENATSPIHPAVMSPLLIWAMRFIEDFAEDIIAGWTEYQRLRARVRDKANPDAVAGLTELLRRHDAGQQPLPGILDNNRATPRLATGYLAALHQTSTSQVSKLLAARSPNIVLEPGSPMDIPVTGRLHGKPWKSYLDHYEAPELMRRLSTAGLIVITYLSGLRTGEALELTVGCCRTRTDDDGTVRYELHGKFFKGARDEDGTALPGGTQREHPWTTIAPVARAISVLERIAVSEFVFAADEPWNPSTATSRQLRTGGCVTSKAAGKRIAQFITWVNDFAEQHRLGPAERIPADPDGAIVPGRFRRTIAWHISRLPGGRVALALQYGHLRTTFSTSGYGNRARHGLRRVLDIETARTIADYLQQVDERLAAGEGVSGPAAQRLIRSAHSARRFEGMFLGKAEVRALPHEPEFQVFDNPEAFLTCNKDPEKALCDPERATRGRAEHRPPSLDRCHPACANIARTDQHIDQARAELDRLEAEAADPLTPAPLRFRLTQRHAAVTAIINQHKQTRRHAGPEPA